MLVTVGIASTWTVSGFLKDIELRHPFVYEKLGRPSPQRTSDSDSHSLALLRFLLANEYKALQDPKLLIPARLLKAEFVATSAAIFTLLVALCFVPSVQGLASLACIRGG